MKKYSDPKMRIINFTGESVVTASLETNTIDNWKETNNGTVLKERKYQEMTALTEIVF